MVELVTEFRVGTQKYAMIRVMKYVYVLEKELKFRKEIHEALVKIDLQLQVRYFFDLETFAKWVTLALKDGNKALALGGIPFVDSPEPILSNNDDQLVMLVTSEDLMGSQSLGLLKKTHQLFTRRGLCTAEMPTSIVITAFDDPDFHLHKVEDPIINNVIYKPFDLMILQQHLSNALNGRRPPEESDLHNMKMTASIEMLKNIRMDAISQAGFVTTSDRPIEAGALAKYYGAEFLSGKTRSVMAKCVRCEPHPELKEKFQVTLNFFALESGQVRDIRKTLGLSKSETIMQYNWNTSTTRANAYALNVVVLDEKRQTVSETLQRNLSGSKVIEYTSWEKFYNDFDPAQSPEVTQKHLPQDGTFKIQIDNLGHFVLGCDPLPKEGDKIFGLTYEQFKKIDISNSVSAESKNDWMNIMRSDAAMTVAAQRVISFDIQNQKKFVKVTQKEKIKTPEGQSYILVSFEELTVEEKINFLKSISRWPKTVDILVATLDFHKKLVEANCKIDGKHFLLADRILTDDEERELGALVQDIFVAPYERSYLTMKIKSHLGLLTAEDLSTYKRNSFVQVANPVEVTEISEGGVVLKYSRAMTVGSFRKFVLWSPSETELLEYTGNCNYTETVEGEDPHILNHFIFFGMKDIFLKNIRLWIRENYIQSKDKSA